MAESQQGGKSPANKHGAYWREYPAMFSFSGAAAAVRLNCCGPPVTGCAS
ncbi:putative transposase [Escherichia coli 8-415-05_S1_C2]|nr:putative transposase [Escherichia coli 8-415-05_S1_C2]